MTVKKKKKSVRRKGPRRHIRKSLIAALLVIVLGITAIIKIPQMMTDSKLRTLGYSETAIKAIHHGKLTDTILNNNYYSDYLAQCIEDGSLNVHYIALYASVDAARGLTDDDLLLYNRLLDLGYEDDQLIDLFQNLDFWEITPLLLFDWQYDEHNYIADCKENHASNSQDSFSLDGDYLSEYKNVTNTADGDDHVLVNTRFSLDASYAPTDITEITTEYAASGQSLRADAANAFLTMAKTALQNGNPFFASASYISYEDQAATYKAMVRAVGSDLADVYSERAGFSEHQTGNAVNISATYDDNANITSTQTYQWLTVNCNKYGFIIRYPVSKAYITGKKSEPAHLLYVGKDLAAKITASKLTYDEYYLLYLNDWYDAQDLPPAEILQSTGCNDTVQAN